MISEQCNDVSSINIMAFNLFIHGVADFFSLMFQYTERGDTNVTALHRFLRCDDFAHLLLALYTTYSIVPYPLAHFFFNIRSGSLI